MAVSAGSARLLLVEPQNLLRRTVVSVAGQLRLATIDEATGAEAAGVRLSLARFDGLIVSLDEGGRMVTLLERLRQGLWPSPGDTPVVVMADDCTEQTVGVMRALGVRRILLKPFKVKDVLASVASLCGAPQP